MELSDPSTGFLLVIKHRLSTCYETGAGGALINFKIGNYYELYYKIQKLKSFWTNSHFFAITIFKHFFLFFKLRITVQGNTKCIATLNTLIDLLLIEAPCLHKIENRKFFLILLQISRKSKAYWTKFTKFSFYFKDSYKIPKLN